MLPSNNKVPCGLHLLPFLTLTVVLGGICTFIIPILGMKIARLFKIKQSQVGHGWEVVEVGFEPG